MCCLQSVVVCDHALLPRTRPALPSSWSVTVPGRYPAVIFHNRLWPHVTSRVASNRRSMYGIGDTSPTGRLVSVGPDAATVERYHTASGCCCCWCWYQSHINHWYAQISINSRAVDWYLCCYSSPTTNRVSLLDRVVVVADPSTVSWLWLQCHATLQRPILLHLSWNSMTANC